jgi:hypothetical protein
MQSYCRMIVDLKWSKLEKKRGTVYCLNVGSRGGGGGQQRACN